MPRPHRYARPDANQPDDVQKLRDLGILVDVVHTLGGTALDLFTLAMHRGYNIPMLCKWEWKTEDGALTPSEAAYLDEVKRLFGEDVPVCVGRCVDDVLRWYGWEV